MNYPGPKLRLLRPNYLRRDWKFRLQHPKVDVGRVRDVLATYGLELNAAPQLLWGTRGQTSAVYTSKGKKVLKKYTNTITEPAIVHEHSILTRLAEIDFPSPRLMTTKAGDTWVRQNGDKYALFDFIEDGFQYHKYVLLPGQSRQFITIAGEMLAMLHDKLHDFVPRGYNPSVFQCRSEEGLGRLRWFMDKLAHCIRQTSRLDGTAREGLANVLLQRGSYLKELLVQFENLPSRACLPSWVIHGDYAPYNLLFRKNAPVVIIDFELACLDWRVTELVYAIWRFCYDRRLGFRVHKMKWLLDAYQTHLRLNQNELELMPSVWRFFHTRQCIMNWDEYCNTRNHFNLARAHWHLNMAVWMTENQDCFNAALSRTSIQFYNEAE